MAGSDDEDDICPLCMDELDLTDKSFLPCECGYQVCLWCYHQIKESLNNKCPACRKPYDENRKPKEGIDPSILEREKTEKKIRQKKKKEETAASRKHLQNVRVVQRTLVYVIGIPPNLARADILRRNEFFGQYGKIVKAVVNRNQSHASETGPSFSAYITYQKQEEAVAAIDAVDGCTLEGRVLRASFGTTKYCSFFLRGAPCNIPDCMYLHELGDAEDSFTKDDLTSGKVAQHVRTALHRTTPIQAPTTPTTVPSPVPSVTLPLPLPIPLTIPSSPLIPQQIQQAQQQTQSAVTRNSSKEKLNQSSQESQNSNKSNTTYAQIATSSTSNTSTAETPQTTSPMSTSPPSAKTTRTNSITSASGAIPLSTSTSPAPVPAPLIPTPVLSSNSVPTPATPTTPTQKPTAIPTTSTPFARQRETQSPSPSQGPTSAPITTVTAPTPIPTPSTSTQTKGPRSRTASPNENHSNNTQHQVLAPPSTSPASSTNSQSTTPSALNTTPTAMSANTTAHRDSGSAIQPIPQISVPPQNPAHISSTAQLLPTTTQTVVPLYPATHFASHHLVAPPDLVAQFLPQQLLSSILDPTDPSSPIIQSSAGPPPFPSPTTPTTTSSSTRVPPPGWSSPPYAPTSTQTTAAAPGMPPPMSPLTAPARSSSFPSVASPQQLSAFTSQQPRQEPNPTVSALLQQQQPSQPLQRLQQSQSQSLLERLFPAMYTRDQQTPDHPSSAYNSKPHVPTGLQQHPSPQISLQQSPLRHPATNQQIPPQFLQQQYPQMHLQMQSNGTQETAPDDLAIDLSWTQLLLEDDSAQSPFKSLFGTAPTMDPNSPGHFQNSQHQYVQPIPFPGYDSADIPSRSQQSQPPQQPQPQMPVFHDPAIIMSSSQRVRKDQFVPNAQMATPNVQFFQQQQQQQQQLIQQQMLLQQQIQQQKLIQQQQQQPQIQARSAKTGARAPPGWVSGAEDMDDAQGSLPRSAARPPPGMEVLFQNGAQQQQRLQQTQNVDPSLVYPYHHTLHESLGAQRGFV